MKLTLSLAMVALLSQLVGGAAGASTSFNSTVADELRSWASTEVLSREDLLDRVAACSEYLGTESWDDYDAAFAATAACVWTGRSNASEILKRAGSPPTASGIVGGLEDFHVWYYRNGDGGGFNTRAWADKRVRQLQEYLGGE